MGVPFHLNTGSTHITSSLQDHKNRTPSDVGEDRGIGGTPVGHSFVHYSTTCIWKLFQTIGYKSPYGTIQIYHLEWYGKIATVRIIHCLDLIAEKTNYGPHSHMEIYLGVHVDNGWILQNKSKCTDTAGLNAYMSDNNGVYQSPPIAVPNPSTPTPIPEPEVTLNWYRFGGPTPGNWEKSELSNEYPYHCTNKTEGIIPMGNGIYLCNWSSTIVKHGYCGQTQLKQ